MFLVCISKNQISRFQKLVTNNISKIVFLPAVSLKKNLANLQYLKKHINEYNYVIFVSPTSIEFAKSAVLDVGAATSFIVMGNASKRLLEKYTNNDVLMPTNSTGTLALIDFLKAQHIKDKKFLIVKGGSTNKVLESWLSSENIFYKTINLYTKKYISSKELKKIVNGFNFSCIIITSSYFVQFLVKIVNFKKVSKIIVLHQNIKNVLNRNGITDNIEVAQENSFNDLAKIINSM